MTDEKLLKNEEKAIFALRGLYKKHGYLPNKMSKFEEYELYIQNKDFLVSDRIITFNDTNGKLMALKPDVTLSIIKSGEDEKGFKQRVSYNENVYRVSGSTHRFKEIMQTGVECIGDIDVCDICDVISLAAQSLALISDTFVLEVSDLGALAGILKSCGAPEGKFTEEALRFISGKNAHDLRRLCERGGLSAENTENIVSLVGTYGKRSEVIKTLKERFGEDAVKGLETLSELLGKTEYEDRINFDFSVVNDMSYYSGFVFRGYAGGICDGVLSGGQYDSLMRRMGRSSGAVGFAIYLDLLEQLADEKDGFDADVLLVYDDSCDSAAVLAESERLIKEGFSVSAQKTVPAKMRFRRTVDMRAGSERKDENA